MLAGEEPDGEHPTAIGALEPSLVFRTQHRCDVTGARLSTPDTGWRFVHRRSSRGRHVRAESGKAHGFVLGRISATMAEPSANTIDKRSRLRLARSFPSTSNLATRLRMTVMFGLRTQYGSVAMDVPDSAEQVGVRIGRAREGSCNRTGRKRLNRSAHTATPTRKHRGNLARPRQSTAPGEKDDDRRDGSTARAGHVSG